MSQNMIALKRQLIQSKLSVLMPSIKFVKWGATGGQKFHWGPRPPWPPLEPPLHRTSGLVKLWGNARERRSPSVFGGGTPFP